MTVINPKSISGITSITTPAGSDNLFTVHTNDTTERFRIDASGHQNISGIVTAANFKTGTSNLHNTGLNIQDLDVDGHTNLDNVSVAGVSTFTVGTNKSVQIYAATHNDETNLGAGIGFSRQSDGVTPLSGIFGHSNTGLGVAARDHITFLTGGSSLVNDTEERLRINSGGRVNIANSNLTGSHLDYTRLNVYGQTDQGGTDKNLNLLNVYNYGSGGVGNITGIGLGCGASPGSYTKASLAFIRTSGYGRGDLIFCINSDANGNQVVEGDEKLRITSAGQVQINTDGGSGAFTLGASQDFRMYHDAGGPTIFSDTGNQGFKLQIKELNLTEYTGNTTRLKINSGGQVLIGTTTNPAYTNRRFTVADSTASGTCAVEIRGSSSGDSRLYFTSSTTSGQTGAYAGKVLYNHANNTMGFYVNGTTQALHIASTGRVGIGEDSPDSLLHIKAGNDRSAIRLENTYDSPDNVWELIPGISGVSNTGFCIHDVTDSANRLVIDGSGKIGINESSPDHIFHIKGSTPILAVESSSWVSGVSAALRLSYTDGDAREIRGHYEKGLIFTLNQGEAMRIATSNKVGINQGSSYNPLTSLDVRHPLGTSGTATLQSLVTICAGRNSSRGLEIKTGRPTSGNQNDAGVYYNAKDTESSNYHCQHVWQLGGNNAMVLGYTGNVRLGVNEQYPDRTLHVSDVGSGGIIRLTNTLTSISDGTICGMLEFEQRDSNTPGVSANIRAEMTDTTNGANQLCFSTGTPSTIGTRMVIDSKGCVRIGNQHTQTTSSNTKRIALGAKGSIWGWTSGQIDGCLTLADNYYWDGSNNKIIESDFASYLSLREGTLRFGSTDAAGTAGANAPGINESFRIGTGGDLWARKNSVVYLVLGSSGDATGDGNTPNNNMNWIRGNATNLQYNCCGGFHAWENGGSEKMKLNGHNLELASATQCRITLGSQGTPGTNDSNWIRGDGNNIMMNCADTSGEHIFEVAGTATARIYPGVGVRAENTCKAWLSYRSEPGSEGIIDDFFVASVSDETTGTFYVNLDGDIGTEDGVAYIFGSHNDGARPLQAVIGYTPSHGSYNPWWSMEDEGTRVNLMRADNNTKVDGEWFSMAAFADTI